MSENIARSYDSQSYFETLSDDELRDALVLLDAGFEMPDLEDKQMRKEVVDILLKNYKDRAVENPEWIQELDNRRKAEDAGEKPYDEIMAAKSQEERAHIEKLVALAEAERFRRLEQLRKKEGFIFS